MVPVLGTAAVDILESPISQVALATTPWCYGRSGGVASRRTRTDRPRVRLCRGFVAVIIACVVTVSTSRAEIGQRPFAISEIADHTDIVRAQVETIKVALGAPKVDQASLDLTFATEREIFHQARTLYRNANQLCFEKTQYRSLPIPVPHETIQSRHIIHVLTGIQDRLVCVLGALRIDATIPVVTYADSVTSRELFLEISWATQQIGLMLAERIRPTLVYRQVTLALSYATRLRETLPGPTMPVEPRFNPSASPTDVFVVLLRCHGLISSIGQRHGQLIPDILNAQTGILYPHNVYDLATIVVAEIQLLHGLFGVEDQLYSVPFPNEKSPPNVYQRARLLELQLRSYIDASGNEPVPTRKQIKKSS